MGCFSSQPLPAPPSDEEFFTKVCANGGLRYVAIEALARRYVTRLALYVAIDTGGLGDADIHGLTPDEVAIARRSAIQLRERDPRLGR